MSKLEKTPENKSNKTIALVLSMPFLVFLLVLIRNRIELLGLFLGLYWETYRIIKNDKEWHFSLFFILLGGCIMSTIVLVDKGIELLAYAIFLLGYSLLFIGEYKSKINIKITEGVSLLYLLSFLYWLIDLGWFSKNGIFILLLNVLILCYLLLVLVNSFSDFELSKNNRFWMSLGTTIMIVIMAIDNYYSVFGIDTSDFHLSDKFLLSLQYFFTGISTIYVVRHFTLLYNFLPQKGESFRKTFKENINDHINRFSILQIKPNNAILCVLYCFICYVINYHYHFLPRNLMIWIVIFTFPSFLYLLDKNKPKK